MYIAVSFCPLFFKKKEDPEKVRTTYNEGQNEHAEKHPCQQTKLSKSYSIMFYSLFSRSQKIGKTNNIGNIGTRKMEGR